VFYDSFPRQGASRPCLAFLVAGTNTRRTTVRVEVDSIQDFRWRIEGWGGGSGGGPIRPNDVIFLAPGQSIHEAYDCPGPISVLPPGEYTAQGQIHSTRSKPVVFLIRPWTISRSEASTCVRLTCDCCSSVNFAASSLNR
jgi:hypothetical protein